MYLRLSPDRKARQGYPDNDTIVRIFWYSTTEILHGTLLRMWGTILQVNSVCWAISGVFFIYSLGNAIFSWSSGSWKQFLLALLLFIFLSVSEVALAALQEP